MLLCFRYLLFLSGVLPTAPSHHGAHRRGEDAQRVPGLFPRLHPGHRAAAFLPLCSRCPSRSCSLPMDTLSFFLPGLHHCLCLAKNGFAEGKANVQRSQGFVSLLVRAVTVIKVFGLFCCIQQRLPLIKDLPFSRKTKDRDTNLQNKFWSKNLLFYKHVDADAVGE